MTDFPWFKTDVQEWVALTDPWTDEQAGVHQRLLCVAWTRGSLPADPQAIRRIRRWSVGAWNRIWPALEPEWPIVDGKRINAALEAHRDDSKRRVEAARSGGKASAAARARGSTDVEPTLNGSSTDVQRIGEPELNTVAKRSVAELSQNVAEREPSTALALSGSMAVEFSPGQLKAAAPGLLGAWNALVASQPALADKRADARADHPKILAALRAHPSLDWWAEVFAKVAASNVLRGIDPWYSGELSTTNFWFVLKHADEIHDGQYDPRAKVLALAPPTKAQSISARNAASAEIVRASLRAEGALS